MGDLILYDNNAGVSNSKPEWKQVIEDMLKDLISPINKHINYETDKQSILQSYQTNITYFKGYESTRIDNIIGDVYLENYEVFKEMAWIDFEENYREDFYAENPGYNAEEDDCELIFETIYELADYLIQEYEEYIDDIEDYIMSILDEAKVNYGVSLSNEIYSFIDYKDMEIYGGDAQNLMFPEIHIDQVEDKCNLTEQQILCLRFVSK